MAYTVVGTHTRYSPQSNRDVIIPPYTIFYWPERLTGVKTSKKPPSLLPTSPSTKSPASPRGGELIPELGYLLNKYKNLSLQAKLPELQKSDKVENIVSYPKNFKISESDLNRVKNFLKLQLGDYIIYSAPFANNVFVFLIEKDKNPILLLNLKGEEIIPTFSSLLRYLK